MPSKTFAYRFIGANVEPPLDGEVRVDTQAQAQALKMWVAHVTYAGADATPYLALLAAGDTVRILDLADGTRYHWYDVTAVPIDRGTYSELAIASSDAGAAVQDATLIELLIVTKASLPINDAGAPPTPFDLRTYLTIKSTDESVNVLLQAACDTAIAYEFGRVSFELMETAGFTPPTEVPVAVAQAMLMRAAAIFRRRNSVNGFEGFGDQGALAIRASDPDIERLIDPWRAWEYA
jgi:hypothetical protein